MRNSLSERDISGLIRNFEKNVGLRNCKSGLVKKKKKIVSNYEIIPNQFNCLVLPIWFKLRGFQVSQLLLAHRRNKGLRGRI